MVSGTLIAYVDVSSGSTLALRKGPTTSSAAILHMNRNTPVYVLAYNSEWARVRTVFGTTGYAAKRYLRASDDKTPVTPKPTETPKPATMTKVSGTKYGYVVSSKLSMYETSSTSSPVMGTLKYGAKVRVYAYNKTWCYAEYNGYKGFLKMSGMSATKPSSSSSSSSSGKPASSSSGYFQGFKVKDTGVTFCKIKAKTTKKCNVYKNYSTSSTVLKVVPKNTELTVTAYNDTWALVTKSGKKGFILLKNLQKVS